MLGDIGSRGVSILLFVASVVLLLWMRPRFLINPETDEWKSFGFGSGKSCINITVIIVMLALIAYLISACVGKGLTKLKQRGGTTPPRQKRITPPGPSVEALPQRTIQNLPVEAPMAQPVTQPQTAIDPFGKAFGEAFSLLQ